jgi:aminoglycoside 2'-N-acetyltransferase I
MSPVRVELAHTGRLAPVVLGQARALLDDVFSGEFAVDDWEHCLGGLHALAWQGRELVGHAALVQRRLLHQGRALRAGYVEGVAVRADVRRRGHGDGLMEPLEQVARRAYAVVALAASDAGAAFYAARGWLPWQGPTSVLTPTGIVRTPDDDDCVLVLPGPDLDRTAELTCDWREGDPW